MEQICIDGEGLSIEDVCRLAKGEKAAFPCDKAFMHTLEKSRAFLEEYIARGYPTYGVTTGFGDSCANQINSARAAKLQQSIVHFHGIGLGNKFSMEEGRAIIACRLNSDVKGGHSAIRPVLAQRMLDMLNLGIIPVIPELGSVGASGDLTPLSYLAAAVMGERDVYYKGQIVEAKEALKKEGLSPLPLAAKEGLAIMNGTSVMTAVAALAWKDAQKLSDISDFLTAAAAEIVRGNEVPFRKKVSDMKGHRGQSESAKKIYSIVSKSARVYRYEDLLEKIGTIGEKSFEQKDLKIQDRYSIRCAPQINGVLRDTLRFAGEMITEEINSANDNPLVNEETGELYNTGNFYGGHVCAACDYLRIALANISDLADKQAEIIIDGKFNGLTENLIPQTDGKDDMAGLRFGFKAAQITMSALRAEVQHKCAPVSITSSPTEALNQDKVSMGTISARMLRDQIQLIYLQFAVHTLAICQAMDVAAGLGAADGRAAKLEGFSPALLKVYHDVRRFSKRVINDRPLDKEAEQCAEYLKGVEIW